MSAPTPPGTPSAPSAPARADAGKRWTVLELLRWTTEHFQQRGIESARLDAECLLSHALGLERLQLYVQFEKPVTPEERATFRELVRKRGTERIPVSQLLGHKEFWSLEFKVTGDVLTPRPDTETLVQTALDRLSAGDHPWRVADIGTGSGAIALAIASERPNAHVVATDISPAALQIAAENADSLQLKERVEFREGDLVEPLRSAREGASEGRFDLIVSNPPYIASEQKAALPPELDHEPELALFGGADGLEVIRRLVAEVMQGDVLEPGGTLLVEIDPGQADAVLALCEQAGFGDREAIDDLTGRVRAIAVRRTES